MTIKYLKTVRPDSKGRVSLGKLAKDISSYRVSYEDEKSWIILEPRVEIPAREKWLYENSKALTQVKKGLEDSAKGRIHKRGSFTK